MHTYIGKECIYKKIITKESKNERRSTITKFACKLLKKLDFFPTTYKDIYFLSKYLFFLKNQYLLTSAARRHWPSLVKERDLLPFSKLLNMAFISWIVFSIWSRKSTQSSNMSPASMFSSATCLIEKLPGTILFLLWNMTLSRIIFP